LRLGRDGARSPPLFSIDGEALMLQRLYDRIMRLAAGPNALAALAVVAFVESSIFPIPPDVLLIPMILATPSRAWRYAAVATAASVAGGFLGYAIGYFAFATIGEPILKFYHAMDRYDQMKESFDEWGAWIIIIKGATPIPYKLLTIASGAFKFDIAKFVVASLISRSMRFFLVAVLLYWFGEPIRLFIERRLMLVTSAFAAALVGGVVVWRYL
jgi:membrane protein YqaA with SNARE-associated domain